VTRGDRHHLRLPYEAVPVTTLSPVQGTWRVGAMPTRYPWACRHPFQALPGCALYVTDIFFHGRGVHGAPREWGQRPWNTPLGTYLNNAILTFLPVIWYNSPYGLVRMLLHLGVDENYVLKGAS